MTHSRDVHDLKAALDEVTPAAPHLAHTVAAAVRAEAHSPGPGRWATGRRLVLSAGSTALVAAVLIAVIALPRLGLPGLHLPAAKGGPAPSSLLSPLPSQLPLGNGYNPLRVDNLLLGSAVSANEAWIVQQHGPDYFGSSPAYSILYRTDDGGARWVEKLRYPGAYDWMRFAADGRTGVVWGVSQLVSPCTGLCRSAPTAPGLIYRTSDGGDHWSRTTTPAGLSVYSIDFLDPSHGWAIMHPPVGSTLTTYATSNGGQTWQQRGTLGPPADITFKPDSGSTRRMLRFSDPNDGVFFPTGIAGPRWPALLATKDGGATWQRVAIQPAADLPANLTVTSMPPTIAPDGSGVLPVLVDANTGPEMANAYELYIATTSDHGRSWTQPRRAFPAGSAETTEAVYRVYVANATHWWVATQVVESERGKAPTMHVLVTSDAGRTWSSPPADSRSIIDLVVVSRTVAWSVYQDWNSSDIRLALTTDAGQRWQPITIPGP